MIRIAVVDDHDLVRMGICSLLADESSIEVIAQGATGEEAIAFARLPQPPHVILMDVRMPGIGGVVATRRITHSHPHIRILAVTALGEDPFPSQLLHAGASGYLTKGSDAEEMVRAVKAVHSGQKYLSPSIAQRLALRSFDPRQATNSPFESLSEREAQIALMVGKGIKVQEISRVLSLSPKTVHTYRHRVFEKLAVTNDVELALLAIAHQFIEIGDSAPVC